MKIAILRERAPNETRVAIVPETVKKYVALGVEVFIEKGAGELASISDRDYEEAGAKTSKVPLEIIADANIILKVQPSSTGKKSNKDLDELTFMSEGAILIGSLSPFTNGDLIKRYIENKITTIAMEFVPRITRAQSMDTLSSQSNLAGYRAVIDAAAEFDKIFPMMMTAAGTVNPAKVLILGAGVAGLQAIATAKRLGAIVSAFDVRPDAKEQVESLGATFIQVESEEDGSTSAGYAKEMSDDYKKKQSELICKTIKEHDIVITTALIPGRPTPKLITKDMVEGMKTGSVIVDLAAVAGGNCELTKMNQIINHKGVKIIGHENYPSRVPHAASKLYSNNLFSMVKLLLKDDPNTINLDFEDEILKKAVVTHQGEIVSPLFKN